MTISPPSGGSSSDIKGTHVEIIITHGVNTQTYRVKASLPLSKLFDVYLSRHTDLSKTSTQFSFEGTILRPDDTAKSLGLYDGCVIHVLKNGTSG